jgi:hypothetical protein
MTLSASIKSFRFGLGNRTVETISLKSNQFDHNEDYSMNIYTVKID